MQAPVWWDHPDDPLLSDFRNYVHVLWDHLGLPNPTPAQFECAYFMQWGYAGYGEVLDGENAGRIFKLYDDEGHWLLSGGALVPSWRRMEEVSEQGRNDILMAFRGIGKSFLAAGFALWRLKRNPYSEKVLIISASGPKAKEFVAMAHTVLFTWDYLEDLRPSKDQRDTVTAFDVRGSSISQSFSLKAVGATGQITGSRATLIIPDDIEIKDNSRTEEARKLLLNTISEFESIRVPDMPTQILVLGTPQSYESIYRVMIKERGYSCFCWPARYPTPDKRQHYMYAREGLPTLDILAPALRAVDRTPSLAWAPTDPQRFNEQDLLSREARGRTSYFLLQFMLDTSLSDAERYPLKAFDLIVANINTDKAPVTVQWGHHTDRKNVRADIPNYGFSGDFLMGALFADPEWRPYAGSILFVDPSGRGADETAWAVVKELNGILWVPEVSGIATDTHEAMVKIAMSAKKHKVNVILVEPNYAGQIWIAAFQPVLAKVWPGGCTVLEADWATGMKEERIIDTLEPVMNQHRLVIDESVARDETLMFQLTHLARERNCLAHDDRIDALAGGVAYFVRALMQDVDQQKHAMLQEETDKLLEDFVEQCTQPSGQRGWKRGKRRGHPDHETEVYKS
jgi:hypothetical protein